MHFARVHLDGLRQWQVLGEDLPQLLVLVGVGIQPEVVVRLGVERIGQKSMNVLTRKILY